MHSIATRQNDLARFEEVAGSPMLPNALASAGSEVRQSVQVSPPSALVQPRFGQDSRSGQATMFEIKEAYSIGPNGDTKMVADEERNVWLQRIGPSGHGRPRGTVFKLVWGDRVIPFDVMHKQIPDKALSDVSDYHLLKHFEQFGGSQQAHFQGGIEPYRFANDAERHEAMILAIEAVLAYGSKYDGFKFPDGHHRFEFEGEIYTKSNFRLP